MKRILEALLDILRKTGAQFGVRIEQRWDVECREWFHEDGSRCNTPHDQCVLNHPSWRTTWEASVVNLVPTVMLNKYLDATLKTGSAAPTWFVGLVDNLGFSAYATGDVMGGGGHGGWSEATNYSDLTRPALTLGTISGGSVSNAAARATFNINGTKTLRGGFICNDSTKGGTTGILGGEADYTAGNKDVASGDTVYITVTCTMTSA